MSITPSSRARSVLEGHLGASRTAYGALLLMVLGVASGCQTLTYQPVATVGKSPEEIPMRLGVRELEDVSPPGDRDPWLLGTAATAPGTLEDELAAGVTKALVRNFLAEGLFEGFEPRRKDPDIVLSGTVHRFYGKANLNTLGVVTSVYAFLWLLGIPIYTSYGAVDLELVFERPDGQRIAAYRSAVEFSELSSFWGNAEYEIGSRLNRAFSDAVRDVREKILADRSLFLEARSPEAPSPSGGISTTDATPPVNGTRVGDPASTLPASARD